jgi:hypothetical protein
MGFPPPLLLNRPLSARVTLALVVPAGYGFLTGVALDKSKGLYVVLLLLAAIGGVLGGFEMYGPRQGALRGLLGGTIFGAFILIGHGAVSGRAKVKLPDPEILYLLFTIIPGILLGAWGGQIRQNLEDRPADAPPAFDLSRLTPGEFIGFAGSAVLFGSLFLPWFKTSCDADRLPRGCNINSVLHGTRGSFTAWETFSRLDVLLTLACIAPFILAWIVVRGHALTWRPGEITMIVGMTATVLILLNGIILGKPGGSDAVGIKFDYGWFLGLIGALGILTGGLLRQAIGNRARKPPGVI